MHRVSEPSLLLALIEGSPLSGSELTVDCPCVVVGLPSAMAAKLVKPDKVVLAVVGDGGFLMNSQVHPVALSSDSWECICPFMADSAACHVTAQICISWPS